MTPAINICMLGFLEWMHWTLPSGLFFGGLFIAILGMNFWDRRSPSIARPGFLPMPTTRGDRFFIGIICTLGIHLIWMAAFGTAWITAATVLSVAWFFVLGRWG